MRRCPPLLAPAALLAAALPLLAGCGIQGSDVVEAGEAPVVVVQPVPESRMLLYYLGPDGELMPVAREVGTTFVPLPERTLPGGEREEIPDHADGSGTGFERGFGNPDVPDVAAVKVLAALLAGPGGADREAGLTTDLPETGELIRVVSEGAGEVRLRTPFLTHELSERALAQLVCTAAHAVDRSGSASVTVEGPDGALPATTCEAAGS
ncbi:hypothetical protein ACF1BN_06430 [Streptomyces sp. NPDC014861]|uniref:hypothetical protein n=1 Tax=Streptomyces sp. NPDC014861 TaxID=3364923 RepID=UPI0036F6ECE2